MASPCICGDEECRDWLEHGPARTDFERELSADGYKWRSGKAVHAIDCATSRAPAYEPGPCDCQVEAA